MKTVSQLTIYDKLYCPELDKEVGIHSIISKNDVVEIYLSVPRQPGIALKPNQTHFNQCIDGSYHNMVGLYVEKSVGLKNMQKELVAKLNTLKKNAEIEIGKVQEFRDKNYQYLNELCTDAYIQNLKRQGL